MPAFAAPSRCALQRHLVVALLCALVLAQALGWLHRGLHGDGVRAGHTPVAAAPSGHAAADASWLHDLFADHGDASDCRLYDGLVQAGCGSDFAAPGVLPPPAQQVAAAQGDFVARWAALFDARGPPASH